jgi:hypothetical protein
MVVCNQRVTYILVWHPLDCTQRVPDDARHHNRIWGDAVSNVTRLITIGKRVKPQKPRPDFPLYAHNVGKWAKTISRRDRFLRSVGRPRGDF